MRTQYKCPDPNCPPTDFAPLVIDTFQTPKQHMCSGKCGKQYPYGSVKVATR